jgi:polyisoprenyl-teichoic acid--peptidoglycan teichoic acid transferase
VNARGDDDGQPDPLDSPRPDSPGALSGLDQLGHEIERAGKKKSGGARHASGRRRHRWRRWVLAGLAAVLVIVLAGAGYVYYLTHDLHRVTVRGLHSAFKSGPEQGTENILMVGSTTRCGLSVQNPAYGLCSQGISGVNSDVMMILHADPAHHRLALLSIPRDLFVPNARNNGPYKIDASLYQGLTQVVAAIEEDLGIPIQHAVSLNFDQFSNIVTALGGINMAFPDAVFDWAPTGGGPDGSQPVSSGLNQTKAACVHLNGTEALQVVRARHLRYETSQSNPNDPYSWQPEGQSDLARIRRDHEFLRVLASAAASQGLSNPVSDFNLINSVKADLTFDQTWPVSDMVNLVLDFHGVDINSVPQLTLPVQVVSDPEGNGGLVYKGTNYGDVEFPSEAQDLASIEQLLGIGATTDSMTGKPLPAPSTVSVSVLNGTGAYNQATDTADAFTALGYHIAGLGDTNPAGDVSETYVYYGSRDTATEAAAESVVRSMSGAVVMAYDPAAVVDGAQVTVVTGSQFTVNAPAPPTPTTSKGSTGSTAATTSPSTTTSTTSVPAASGSAAGAIQAPNPSTTKLAPWDPRACAPGAAAAAPTPNPT